MRNISNRARDWGVAFGLVVIAGAARAEPAEPAVSITFVHPEKYTDAVLVTFNPTDRDRTEIQDALQAHLTKLAGKNLKPGDRLEIQVLDIDLAGRPQPIHLAAVASDFRVVREQDWPAIKLHYTLRRGEQVVADREETLVRMNFISRGSRYPTGDRLRYEKEMIDDWFGRRIGKQR